MHVFGFLYPSVCGEVNVVFRLPVYSKIQNGDFNGFFTVSKFLETTCIIGIGGFDKNC